MRMIDRDSMRNITGAATKARQIAVLTQNRIPFTVRADGWPATTWEAYQATLTGGAPPATNRRPPIEPNFAAIS